MEQDKYLAGNALKCKYLHEYPESVWTEDVFALQFATKLKFWTWNLYITNGIVPISTKIIQWHSIIKF